MIWNELLPLPAQVPANEKRRTGRIMAIEVSLIILAFLDVLGEFVVEAGLIGVAGVVCGLGEPF